MSDMVSPLRARICRSCTMLVTVSEWCPLCGEYTQPKSNLSGEDYCIECGKGPFLLSDMHLLTWEEDPYRQADDGDLSCICQKCYAEA